MRESRVVALVGRHLCPLPRAAPQPAARMAPYAPPNVGNDPSTGSGPVSVPRAAAAAGLAAPASSPALSAAAAAQVGDEFVKARYPIGCGSSSVRGMLLSWDAPTIFRFKLKLYDNVFHTYLVKMW